MQRRVRTLRLAVTILGMLAVTGTARAATPRADYDIVPLTVALRSGSAPLPPVYAPATNAVGDTAYLVRDPAGERLEVRDGIGFVRAIAVVGDPLAGSAIVELAIGGHALDAYQQVTFWAALADGRAGLFRASPPATLFAITPKVGYRDQPITIQVIGRGFAPGVKIRVGSADAGLITIVSPTELTGMLPAGAPLGTADVTVTRANGTTHVLRSAFEFRDRPRSGCRGFWPDHRPPVLTASALLSEWIVPIGIIAAPTTWRRLTRRRRTRGSRHRPR